MNSEINCFRQLIWKFFQQYIFFISKKSQRLTMEISQIISKKLLKGFNNGRNYKVISEEMSNEIVERNLKKKQNC